MFEFLRFCLFRRAEMVSERRNGGKRRRTARSATPRDRPDQRRETTTNSAHAPATTPLAARCTLGRTATPSHACHCADATVPPPPCRCSRRSSSAAQPLPCVTGPSRRPLVRFGSETRMNAMRWSCHSYSHAARAHAPHCASASAAARGPCRAAHSQRSASPSHLFPSPVCVPSTPANHRSPVASRCSTPLSPRSSRLVDVGPGGRAAGR